MKTSLLDSSEQLALLLLTQTSLVLRALPFIEIPIPASSSRLIYNGPPTHIRKERKMEIQTRLSQDTQLKRGLVFKMTMLKSWVRNRALIAGQKKRLETEQSLQYHGKENKMEQVLFKEFQQERKLGKAIGCQ
jgi:hypothetical protein